MGSHASAVGGSPRRPRTFRAGEAAAIRGILNTLRRVVRDLRLTARAAERIAGVSGAQLFVLQALAEGPAASIGDLAERTSTDQSSVSVVVQRLVEKGLVARAPSPEDGRRVAISLTAGGKRVLVRCPEPTQARILEALRRLRSEELAALATGTAALEEAMGLASEAPRMFFEEATESTKLRPVQRAARARAGKPAAPRKAR